MSKSELYLRLVLLIILSLVYKSFIVFAGLFNLKYKKILIAYNYFIQDSTLIIKKNIKNF
ncbi:hypothetical protein HN415_08050 [Candidatus Woesearchaeota archaeon]|nr:hypothetical protein [Candidatus Woesearchaeota archaeon]